MNRIGARAVPGDPAVATLTIALAVIAFFLAGFNVEAAACGTLPAEQQRQQDAEQLQRLRVLAMDMAKAADAIFVGSVTALQRPDRAAQQSGQVTLAVTETLKGPQAREQTLAWDDHFIYSCDPAAMFGNVGFRDGGVYIVYVKDDWVIRSDAADALRDSSLLGLSDEISLLAARGGE
ncbi:MAG: hypothetical protein WAR01_15320 [Dokdonella sp.]|uniref:hypothetical protein n=1 Tax=Dokdonella sp. TaxID=2291710 RepID=UPI003BB1FF45